MLQLIYTAHNVLDGQDMEYIEVFVKKLNDFLDSTPIAAYVKNKSERTNCLCNLDIR